MSSKRSIWFYVFVGVLFIGMLVISRLYFNGSGRSTVGVTYAKEYIISAEKPSLVKHVNVVSGQEVKVGDLLVELSSRQLDMDIDRLANRINALKSERNEKLKLLNSTIAYSKAQHNIVIESIEADIAELKSNIKLNDQLTKEFVARTKETDHSQDPHVLRLASLDQQKNMHVAALSIKINDLVQQSNAEQALLTDQIVLLEHELSLLNDEKRKLSKYATFNGVVENVYVKNAEEAAAFAPMLSVNPSHPTSVVGYFIGKKEREIPMASTVTVMSYDHHLVKAEGKVIGFGSVVELPVILQKSTAVKAFGREVFIEISPANDFATGEKVLIK